MKYLILSIIFAFIAAVSAALNHTRSLLEKTGLDPIAIICFVASIGFAVTAGLMGFIALFDWFSKRDHLKRYIVPIIAIIVFAAVGLSVAGQNNVFFHWYAPFIPSAFNWPVLSFTAMFLLPCIFFPFAFIAELLKRAWMKYIPKARIDAFKAKLPKIPKPNLKKLWFNLRSHIHYPRGKQ